MWPAEIVDQAVWWSDVVGIMFFGLDAGKPHGYWGTRRCAKPDTHASACATFVRLS